MSRDEIIRMLQSDGYRDAVQYICSLESEVNVLNKSRRQEFEYLLEFVKGNDFSVTACYNQFRSLWVAYCLHHGLAPDTSEYDNDLLKVWHMIEDSGILRPQWKDFNQFDLSMGDYLS